MPFDSNFIQQRNMFLNQSIKNQKLVAEQFYPRYVQMYNNNVPFTENNLSISTIDHPSLGNSIIKSYLKPDNLQTSKDNLNLKLTQITGNEDISNFIINGLKNEDVIYYNEHFSEVQNHLLKLIHLPTSKESFLSNLKQLLANDPHSKSINVIASAIMPPPPPQPIMRQPQVPAPYISPVRMMPRSLSLRSRLKNLSEKYSDDSSSVASSATVRKPKGVASGSKRGTYNTAQKSNIVMGTGLSTRVRQIKQKVEFGKYAIDLKKLSNNILAIKYSKTGNTVPTFKPIEISDDLKTIIKEIQESNVPCGDNEIANLSEKEQRIIRRLLAQLGLSTKNDGDDEFVKNFQICYGSYLAGNDSVVLKSKLKEYVKLAIHEGIITQQVGTSILQHL